MSRIQVLCFLFAITLPAAAQGPLAERKPRVALAAESGDVFQGVDSLEAPGSGRVPNYLRALAPLPGSIKPFASLMKTFLYGGTLAPEVKLAMALRIAELNESPYTTAHIQRLLRSTERGAALLQSLRESGGATLSQDERVAIAYAEALTKDIHAPRDAEFRETRGWFNDAQIVELTFTVCLFNYFSRYAEALQLPIEPWLLTTKPASAPGPRPEYAARVSLISDDEMAASQKVAAAAAASTGGLGLGIANSQRAMMRVPELGMAWRGFGFTQRDAAAVGRDIKLQISLAVSVQNGCRYCTIHQVVGLRRLGVQPAKLLAMQKDDAVLTTRELAAVRFARKLTSRPASITDGDFDAIRREFGEQGALEVLMQTCNFAFMNRFTDGLRLPSEDEAVRIYQETYGSSARYQQRR